MYYNMGKLPAEQDHQKFAVDMNTGTNNSYENEPNVR